MRITPALRRGAYAALLCLFSYHSPAHAVASCSAAGDSVAPPSGAFLRTLYDTGFELPTHASGTFPAEGMGPSTAGFYGRWHPDAPESHKGNPEVVASQPLLDGQSAEFNAKPIYTDQFDYDELDFQLGRAADYYTLDADLVIDNLTDANRLLVQIQDSRSIGAGC